MSAQPSRLLRTVPVLLIFQIPNTLKSNSSNPWFLLSLSLFPFFLLSSFLNLPFIRPLRRAPVLSGVRNIPILDKSKQNLPRTLFFRDSSWMTLRGESSWANDSPEIWLQLWHFAQCCARRKKPRWSADQTSPKDALTTNSKHAPEGTDDMKGSFLYLHSSVWIPVYIQPVGRRRVCTNNSVAFSRWEHQHSPKYVLPYSSTSVNSSKVRASQYASYKQNYQYSSGVNIRPQKTLWLTLASPASASASYPSTPHAHPLSSFSHAPR